MVGSSVSFVLMATFLVDASPVNTFPTQRLATVGQPVRVTTKDGRMLRGVVAAKTNSDRLCLIATEQGIELTNFVPWSRVAQIDPGEPISLPPVTARRPEPPRRSNSRGPSRLEPADPEVHSHVQSLDAFAWPANWDADAEIDGLRVWIAPLSASGSPVRTNGTVTVRLEAAIEPQPLNADSNFVDSWTVTVEPLQLGPDGLKLDLPFHSRRELLELLAPQTNYGQRQLAAVGRIHVRLAIAGKGTFDAVRDIPLR